MTIEKFDEEISLLMPGFVASARDHGVLGLCELVRNPIDGTIEVRGVTGSEKLCSNEEVGKWRLEEGGLRRMLTGKFSDAINKTKLMPSDEAR